MTTQKTPEERLAEINARVAADPTPANAAARLRELELLRASEGTRELAVDRLAQIRALAKTFIGVWAQRDQTSAECGAELLGALVAVGVLSPDDYHQLRGKHGDGG